MSTSRKITLIIATLLGVAAIVVSGMSAARESENACITPKDYKDFYGEQAFESQFDPKNSFFSKSYTFLSGSSELSTSESDSFTIDAGNIAQFYQTHLNTPFTLTLSAAYNTQTDLTPKKLAEERTLLIVTALKNAGLPSSIISSSTVDNATDPSDASDDQGANLVTLNMASSSSCRE